MPSICIWIIDFNNHFIVGCVIEEIQYYNCLVLGGSFISLIVFFLFSVLPMREMEECVKGGSGYTGSCGAISSAVRSMISLCIMRVHVRKVTKKLGFEDYSSTRWNIFPLPRSFLKMGLSYSHCLDTKHSNIQIGLQREPLEVPVALEGNWSSTSYCWNHFKGISLLFVWGDFILYLM